MKELLWRLLAAGTLVVLAALFVFVYTSAASVGALDWAYEAFVRAYPFLVLLGLVLWRLGVGRRPASGLFKLAAAILFALPLVALLLWAGWTVGFGEPYKSLLSHLLTAAIPSVLLLVAYLIVFRSPRFAWINVVLLALVSVAGIFSLIRLSAAIAQPNSRFDQGDLIRGVAILVAIIGLVVLNVFAALRPGGRREPGSSRPGPVWLWQGLGGLAVVGALALTLGYLERPLSQLRDDAMEARGEELVAAVEEGDIRKLKAQLDAQPLGVPLSADALVLAAQLSRPEAVRLLAEAGADLEAETMLERAVALPTAAHAADAPTVTALLDLGADPDHGAKVLTATAYDWLTPLGAAAEAARPENVRALLEREAQVDLAAEDGVTPLMRAARQGDTESLRLLLEAGAAVGASDAEKTRTALHHAAAGAQASAYEMLVGAGADAGLRDAGGQTAEELLDGALEAASAEDEGDDGGS